MSDRINAFTIVLDKDIKNEDVQDLLTALKMLKGVISVTPNVADISDHIAQMRERARINHELIKIIDHGI